jgi:hypothetical protein
VPTKVAYKRLETDPSLEFEHFLAQKLGMTVADMRQRMSGEEFTSWAMYYARLAQRSQLESMKGGR